MAVDHLRPWVIYWFNCIELELVCVQWEHSSSTPCETELMETMFYISRMSIFTHSHQVPSRLETWPDHRRPLTHRLVSLHSVSKHLFCGPHSVISWLGRHVDSVAWKTSTSGFRVRWPLAARRWRLLVIVKILVFSVASRQLFLDMMDPRCTILTTTDRTIPLMERQLHFLHS